MNFVVFENVILRLFFSRILFHPIGECIQKIKATDKKWLLGTCYHMDIDDINDDIIFEKIPL